MKTMKKRFLGILLSLALVLGLMPGMSLTAQAADTTELTTGTTTWANGDYVVPADGVTISGHITVKGIVNLTLTEGATLTANMGITLGQNARLNVSGKGAMVVNGSNGNTNSTVAGTGKLVLKSGTLTATGGNGQSFSSGTETTGNTGGVAINGTVAVNGGTLAATGGNGGSLNAGTISQLNGGTGGVAIGGAVTINGGTVTATGGNGGSITITNYGDTNRGGNGGAAIGGAVTINGGTMTVTKGGNGTLNIKNGSPNYAGTGSAGYDGTLTLGANVKLYEGTDDTGTVLDGNDSDSRVYSGEKKANMYAYGSDVDAVADKSELNDAITVAEKWYGRIKNNTDYTDIASALKTAIDTAKAVADNDEAGQDVVDTATQNLITTILTAEASISMGTTWEEETYVVPIFGETIADHITVTGTVNLILTKGATLTANAGITLNDGATLNVSGDGAMVINGTNGNANSTVAGTGELILKSGTLTANGGNGGSIGNNGYQSTSGAGGAAINGAVTVKGGTLTAIGGTGGSIGNYGYQCTSGAGGAAINGAVTVNGGTLTATDGAKGTGGSTYGCTFGAGGAGYSGTLTLGKGVKLYEGTEANNEKLLDGNDSTSRVYEGEKKASMYAYGPDISQGPDKTALNDAITAAETLYDSIKDNTDYADIANTFQTAINTAKGVADSDEVDQDAVDTATTNIITANTTAIIGIINALPAASDVTMDDKAVIEAVRAAYDALDDTQKALVDADTLKKLTDAEAALKDVTDKAAANTVSETINALPDADDVTTANKDDIEAARKDYDDLTDDQKAKVSDETLKKLTDAEEALEVAEVIETITDLKAADEVTTADKDDIEAARTAYDALTPAQQAKVPADTLKKLTDAESALEVAEVIEAITALKAADEVTTADKTDIEAARAAYEALTDDQKEKVSADTLKKLTDAESALEVAVVNKAIADLPNAENVTVNDKDDIEAARTVYEALTDDQKTAVDADAITKLEAVEVALVNKTIEALPEAASVTANDKDAIEAAKAAYDALSDTQKTNVGADEKAKLEVCEVALAIAELPAANKVTVSDNKAIKAARDAYDALTKDQQTKISEDALKKLTDAEDKILIIETVSELVSDQAKADEVTDRINNALPAVDEITLEDETKVAAARMAYELLTDAQKDLVSEETLNKLEAAEKKISDLKEQAALDAAKDSAIERLEVYAEARAKADATEEEKAAFDKAVADGKKAINEAKTQEAVAEALTNAKTLVNEAIAKIEKDRADAAAAAAEMAAADKAVEDANTGAEAAKNAAEEAAANEYASDADKNAISTAKETLDAKIKAAEDLPAGATAQQKNDAAKAIEDAVKALNEAVDTANIHSATAKAEAEAAATAAEQLAAAKTTAIDRLDIYAEARAKADATADEKAAFDKAVADGKKAINDVESQETVVEALTNAKTLVDEAIAKIEKDRAAAAAAAAEMAAADKALEDANAAAQTAKTDAEAATANKYASDEDKNAISTAKETLDAKIKAAEELPADATAQQKNDAAKAIEDAVKALNEAVDTANIHSAAAKAEADAAATAAEQLAAAKTAAIERLDDYSEAKAKSDATAGEKAAYDKAVADGKTAVNAATDIDAVTTALKGAKAAVDAAIAKIEKDRAAADKVADAISKLTPSDKVRTTDKAAIEAAGDAYDALTADQKDLIPSDVLKKLTDAQKALMEADNKPADLPSDAEAKEQTKISNQKRDEMVDLLNSKGTHEVKGIYQTGYDTVKANYVIINGKITQMSIDTSSLKEGKNYLTINTGVRLVLGDYFTVSGNTVDAKDAKKIAKFVKIKKEGCVFEPKRLKSHKGGSYQVILTNGKIELIVDVIDVSLNKMAIKKITLTGAVNKDAVSANAVAADKIGAEGSSVSGNVVTIATSPAFKSEIPSMKDKSARFISGIWQVGDTYVSMGEVKTVTKGKVSVIVKANSDGTLSIGKAEGSSRGSIKINYVLNGKVKKTRRGTKIKSMVYKAKVKVK